MEEKSLDELAQAYKDLLRRRQLAATTLAGYCRYLDQLVQFLRQRKRVRPSMIRAQDLEAFRRWILRRASRPPKVTAAPGSAAMACASLLARRFCAWLVQTDHIVIDPGSTWEPIPKRRTFPQALTLAEMERILQGEWVDEPSTLRDRAVLEVLYSTGIRIAELGNLDLTDIDLAEGLLTVRRGKGGRSRFVPLGEPAVKALRAYLEEGREGVMEPDAATPALFPGSRASRISSEAVGYLMRKRAQEVGISRRLTPHVFRHTAAVHLLRGGASLRVVQEFLGHEDLGTTAHYTKLVLDDLKEACRNAHPRDREDW